MTTHTLDLFALVLLLLLVVIMPLVGIWDFNRLKRWTQAGRPDARTKTYRWILAMEWGLAIALVAWWSSQGRAWSALGLAPAAASWRWLAIGIGLLAAALLIYQLVSALRDAEELAKISRQVGELGSLAPRTPDEKRLFTAVAITAGICEEVVYRGILLAALSPVLGTWTAVALSSVIFGLGHVYQGPMGIAKTTLVGLVLALLAVFSGSLFVPMLLHAVIDLTSGKMMSAALDSEEGASVAA